jgi:hypothetical protein
VVRIWLSRAGRWEMALRMAEEAHHYVKEEVDEVGDIGSDEAAGIELEDMAEAESGDGAAEENGDGTVEERGVDARTTSEKMAEAAVVEEEHEKNGDAELAVEVEETAGGAGVVAAVGMRE